MKEGDILALAILPVVALGCLAAPDLLLVGVPLALVYVVLRGFSGPGWDTPVERRRRALSVLALVVINVVGCAAGTPMIFVTLVGGWISFLGRTLPQVRFDPAAAAVGAVCLVLFAAGVHWSARTTWNRPATGDRPARTWKPRWTFAVIATVVLLFASGLAAVGLVHTGRSVWELR